ncbi:MAG TPA: glutathione S-transferase N-terminal domain-containing protein [Solirubrobacteraceae bacterium]|jgi:glutathione S-transferase|nr:glutathione S-transferase N-terminal domain-containing protein [Solirubrobacteraceae bacterium]
MSSNVRLYMFPGSNAVFTARLMLDHKEIDYKAVKLLAGPHAFVLLAKGFPTMAVPALKAGGVRVQGTRWIARALDELVPERPLFPSDPDRRKAVEDAERWGEGLQNATRRIFYCAARRDRGAFASVMTAERGPVKRAIVRLSAPLVIRLATGVHRATDDHGREDLQLLPERLDRIDAWIEEGLLNGPELNAADFQIAANVAALMVADDLRPFIEGRPAAALARRVAPGYEGHIPAGLPDEWLDPLRAAARDRDPVGAGA